MGRKRENAPDSEGAPVPPGTEETATLTPRLSVQLDEHGAIAFDRMRADTRDKLCAAIARSGLSVPAAGSVAAPVAESFPPGVAEVLYDSLSTLLIGLARRDGYTAGEAAVLAFNADEKSALVPATIKVLDKYNASLGKYQEEIVLGVLLVTITSGKLSLLKKSAPVIDIVR